uniref:Uncharacterized protein n=1 Tax=Balaenoptera musculus TaxID=9771 RepID=A0A8C0DMF2_BALMU
EGLFLSSPLMAQPLVLPQLTNDSLESCVCLLFHTSWVSLSQVVLPPGCLSPLPWPEPVLWRSSLTSPAPSVSWVWPGPDLTGLFSQDTSMSGVPRPGVAAVSPCVSRPGPGFCFLPSFLCIRCCSEPHLLGSLVDLFGLSPVHPPTGLYLGVGGLVL